MNLLKIPIILVLNKMDMPGADEARLKFLECAEEAGEEMPIIISLSALTGQGTDELVRRLAEYHIKHPARDQIFEQQVKHREPRELAVSAVDEKSHGSKQDRSPQGRRIVC